MSRFRNYTSGFSGDDTDRSNAAGLPLMPQLLTSSLEIVTFFNNNDERAYV